MRTPPARQLALAILATCALMIVYEPQYYIDQADCESAFEKMIHDHLPQLQQSIQIVKILPDPPPPGTMNKVLEQAEAIRVQIAHVAVGNRDLAEQVARYVALKLKVGQKVILRE